LAEPDFTPKIAILILAAGASSRMGSPKQLLKWGNSTLLNHSIKQAVNSKANHVFVVLGAHYNAINKTIHNQNITLLPYNDWKLGMGNSIAFGIKNIISLNFDSVLIMLVDQPLVNTEYVNKLIKASISTNKPITATSYPTGVGVPAIFNKQYFNKLADITGEKGAKNLIEQELEKVNLITPKTPLEDIDTPEAYKLAISKSHQ